MQVLSQQGVFRDVHHRDTASLPRWQYAKDMLLNGQRTGRERIEQLPSLAALSFSFAGLLVFIRENPGSACPKECF